GHRLTGRSHARLPFCFIASAVVRRRSSDGAKARQDYSRFYKLSGTGSERGLRSRPRCQGRSKTHPLAPGENAPPLGLPVEGLGRLGGGGGLLAERSPWGGAE